MSDQTYSWQIEMKNGDSTRVDGVAVSDANLQVDLVQMLDEDGSTLFFAPLSSLSYAKRVEPSGMKNQSGSISVAIPADGVARKINTTYPWQGDAR